MKKKILLFTASAAMLSVALMSYNLGPASQNSGINMNKTGALSSGTCADAGCHTSGSGTLGSFAKIVDKTNGWDVTSHGYVEGRTYTVTLQGTNVSLVNFGFQACALFDTDQKPAGTLVATNPLTAVRPTKTTSSNDTVWVVEHKSAMAGTSGVFNVMFDWTAPAVGSNKGAVKFWGIVNAVNGNNQSTGDVVSPGFTKVFANKTSVEDLKEATAVKVWPNPLVGDNTLKIELKNSHPGQYTITAFDMYGKKMFVETHSSNVMPFEYPTSNWTPGMYHVQIANKEGMTHTSVVVKY